uniref:Protein phosphatase 2C n=1 Tax=Marseillevirus LCMAC101 TaxID=2506602 RepID=A0A481YSX2_9VIRU|nr:MAG: protein phosphatase 2C [Marseillevirus LCMAC101]
MCLDGKINFSEDHKPSNPLEEERIRKAGGYVSNSGRIDSCLAVSRALGDSDYKGKQYEGSEAKVSPIPDVTEFPFSNKTKIIMASDGFFDTVEENDMILKYINLEDPCGNLMEYSLIKGSLDNIIIMMLDLSQDSSL